mgnify:CR=1 FL=1
MHRKVSELRQMLGRVAKDEARTRGLKRRGGKWKSWNPKYWEDRYGLIDMVVIYYQRRKQLYAALFEHPINATA